MFFAFVDIQCCRLNNLTLLRRIPSLALLTASQFGLPESIIKRADELSKYWDAEKAGHFIKSGVNVIDRYPNVNDLQYATSILEETAGAGSILKIPPSYMSPPSFEGKSCVYILQIGDKKTTMRYYVGETDSLASRLSDHRSKGGEWSSLNAIAIEIDEGKSRARNVESLVIQKLAKSGFNMISISDGRSIRSWNR